ncbi:hypothetical protein BATDEDRAFT_19794 [Batrachochytrium dendrobatidis JAM81]|uniref:RRM domain-containing protein n=1 Tax=Batrachochytrium dendrobatidis (strain JAM81 / FGSC 10211) TaxID=684364 RepID=F4P4G8_BATDJ|nr:uncharacterized protein BATDEDRAFT_19794 [Batrachochytrium dendrobatidis JAM81]EGF79920.1 hypothetical protein BATDEDRAFT_19794 [Batrachochytrium dendrobatidis JAM81]|eukprot:XP_006679395.1 hypothetical protein BATDEDRAFT_19794 [Batrachochytrium dendrobatidis JAM81]
MEHSRPESSGGSTLWMGDLLPWMDEHFIRQTWRLLGESVTVKMIKDKSTGSLAGYCFVEFSSSDVAAKLLELVNGTLIPGTHCFFKLNWAFGGGLSPLYVLPEFSIFVGDLAHEINDILLMQVFHERYPSVKSARVVIDPTTGSPKGYGFVRFGSEADQQQSLVDLQGQMIGSRPVRVSIATPKHKALGSNGHGMPGYYPIPPSYMDASGAMIPNSAHMIYRQPVYMHQHLGGNDPTNSTIFIGALPATMTNDDLRKHFLPFGEIVYTKIPFGKRCGFVQFIHRQSAEMAIQEMDGKVIGGSALRLSWGRSQRGNSTHSHMQHLPAYGLIQSQFGAPQYMPSASQLIHAPVTPLQMPPQMQGSSVHSESPPQQPPHLPHGMIAYMPVHSSSTHGYQYIDPVTGQVSYFNRKEDQRIHELAVEFKSSPCSSASYSDMPTQYTTENGEYTHWEGMSPVVVAAAAEDLAHSTE